MSKRLEDNFGGSWSPKPIVTEGTCRCVNPRPFKYLSSMITEKGLQDVYRCDSCGKHVYKMRVPTVIQEER